MRRTRPPSLLLRIMLANALVLVAGAVALAATPFHVSYPAAPNELVVLAVAVIVMVVIDGLLVRLALAPVERLRESMRRVDPLEPGERIDSGRAGRDMAALARGFNEMADRLEAERRESARRDLAGREEERRTVARELHDEVGQTMTALLAVLERLARRAPEELRPEVTAAQDAARAGLSDLRRVVTRLRPDTLDDLGLLSALRALARRMGSASGIEVVHRLDPYLPPLDAQAELVVYRIAQEALTNAVRHAQASSVEMTLDCGDDGLVLVVCDDGQGLFHNGGPASGIRGMRERALLVGGRLRVAERPAGGVEVVLEIPILEAHR